MKLFMMFNVLKEYTVFTFLSSKWLSGILTIVKGGTYSPLWSSKWFFINKGYPRYYPWPYWPFRSKISNRGGYCISVLAIRTSFCYWVQYLPTGFARSEGIAPQFLWTLTVLPDTSSKYPPYCIIVIKWRFE